MIKDPIKHINLVNKKIEYQHLIIGMFYGFKSEEDCLKEIKKMSKQENNKTKLKDIETVNGLTLSQVLTAIKMETQPIKDHENPNNLDECWKEVFKTLENTVVMGEK